MEESTRLTTEEVRHIALLARIGMEDDEVEEMRGQLSDILEQFEALSSVDTGEQDPGADGTLGRSAVGDA